MSAVEKTDWKKKAVVYQIYPRSFADSNGDGLGDIPGIIDKLDYIKELGCDVIWLTPVYDSPQNDNGYDIADYQAIYPPFGTMEDLETLLEEAHKRDIKLVMDMVVNHTSTDHEWFRQSRSSRDNPYRDYYIWRDPAPDGGPPTNWVSKFGGNAWEFDEETGQYYLHLFDVTQADLNWENPKVREDVYEMMRWWFDKGMDGFRLDVVNLLSKDQDFPQAPPGTDGRQFYTDGPRIHEYLHEMNKEAFQGKLTVGEMSSTTVDHCVRYTRPENEELDMTFSFHHLKVDYPDGEKWTDAPMDFQKLKDILTHWQVGMAEGGGWNAVFWCNHDQPRVVSRFGDDGEYRVESAKMLATAVHLLQGTPYIYQGEEFGMTNPHFTSIEQYKDVESLNAHRELLEKGIPEEEVMAILDRKSRDNSRTPVQWNDAPHAGFTTGEPWIEVAQNYPEVNAEAAVGDPDSVFHHYRKLIDLRKTEPLVTTGEYELLDGEHPSVYAYARNGEEDSLIVVNNFFADPVRWEWPEQVKGFEDSDLVLANLENPTWDANGIDLRPYESVVLKVR